ncbi:MAG: phosphoribosyltransferase family protein [Erysipelotrichia bacterium]|nr:phosphoribosyltransferase family protein [Erysipelotrichia bacterium]
MRTECYCLNCMKSIRDEGCMGEMLLVDDVLCAKCRYELKYYPHKIKIGKMKVFGMYRYCDLCRELLIQYKEYKDEALGVVFLYPHIDMLRRRYKDYYLVAIPSNFKSFLERGFRHVETLFSPLGLPFLDILQNSSDRQQKNLPLAERKNIFQYLHLQNNVDLTDKKLLLVDDILTTGSTLNAAYSLLENKCKKVECLVVAYNERYLSDFQKKLYGLTH